MNSNETQKDDQLLTFLHASFDTYIGQNHHDHSCLVHGLSFVQDNIQQHISKNNTSDNIQSRYSLFI